MGRLDDVREIGGRLRAIIQPCLARMSYRQVGGARSVTASTWSAVLGSVRFCRLSRWRKIEEWR
jgi:hypothetical protein